MKKILFIEDDPDQISIFQTKFELEALTMLSADSEQKAVSLAKTDKPDLILLDLLLRNEDGLDVLERLKTDKELADIPVIVFTNYDTKECRERAEKLGAADYIIKAQTTPGEIVQMVKKKLGI